MPDVSYIIRIQDNTSREQGGKFGSASSKIAQGNLNVQNSVTANPAGNLAQSFLKNATPNKFLSAAGIALSALNKLDNLRISLVGVTTGNYTYQRYQEAVKEIVTHPISYLFGFWERAETKVKNEAQLSLDSFTTYQRNIRAGSMGNRVPRKQ